MKKISFFILCSLGFICVQAQEKKIKDIFLTDKEFNKNLSKWLNFHELSIDAFQLDWTNSLSLEEDTSSIYYRKFDEYQFYSDSILENYSANKRRYVSLLPTKGVFYDDDDEHLYKYIGGDDCEEIYYTDLDAKKNQIIQWNGVGQHAEDLFWLNNDTFAIVNVDLSQNTIYSIDIYTILEDKKNEVQFQRYTAITNRCGSKSYFLEVVLKDRNIKVD